MAELFNDYKCPACNGTMSFDAASGNLKCDYCGTEMSVAEAKAHYAEENKKVAATSGNSQSEDDSNWGTDAGSMKAYRCQSCGAELVCDETTAATSCPYCGNTAVMPQQFGGMMKPKYVIPFKVPKDEAVGKLNSYCKGKKLLPKAFVRGNHIQEVKGVYVPFWLYSGTVDADIHYEAETEEVKKTQTEKITTTKYYKVHRKGTVEFQKIPADASSSMPDDLMDSIEPYDYKDLRPFEMEYLPGYLADKYDVSAADSRERARKRAVNSTESIMRDTVTGYDRVNEVAIGKSIKFMGEKDEYAMMPVWLLSTNWDNKNFLFAINGQTGEMTGNLPVDKGKQALCNIIAGVLGFGLPMIFMGSSAWIICLIIAAIAVLITNSIMMAGMKPVSKKAAAGDYVQKNGSGKNDGVKLTIKDDQYIRTSVKKEPIEKKE